MKNQARITAVLRPHIHAAVQVAQGRDKRGFGDTLEDLVVIGLKARRIPILGSVDADAIHRKDTSRRKGTQAKKCQG